ncbi:MAG: hypothetical protein VXA50_08400, partial [bacterium]
DDLKDNMKEWGVSAVEKAEEISRVAVAKGEEFTKISKLKFDILQLQKDKNKVYEKLGLLVYNKTNESNVSNFTGDVEYFSLIEKINKFSIEISEKNEDIIAIKKEYGIDDSDFEENYQSTGIISIEEEE